MSTEMEAIHSSVQFSSVQVKMVSVYSEKTLCAQSRPSEVSPLKRIQSSSDGPFSPFQGDHRALPFTPLSSRRSKV